MPDPSHVLSGVEGRDYTFVSYGGKTYVVYRVKTANGKYINMSWRVSDSDFKAFGVNPQKVKAVNSTTFRNLQYFGNAQDVVGTGVELADKHPFQVYLQHLQDVNGHVSWLKDKEFVGTMLMGFVEGWSSQEIQQKLTQTKWYQSRTEQQRHWAMDLSKGDRTTQIGAMSSRMDEYMRELYGPNADMQGTMTKEEKASWAKKIASGVYGSPEDGFAIWQQEARSKAEKVSGTPAWIDKEKTIEEGRAFMNRPEDAYLTARDAAYEWLGPQGMPDTGTLRDWAVKMTTEKKSDADFQAYLEQKAHALYPFLGQGESWQSRASGYKRAIEDAFGGTAVDWSDPLLQKIGTPDGTAMSMSDYEQVIRGDTRFWQGSQAKQEGFDLFSYLNSTFNGIS